jgi:hypothetical protein
VKKVPTALIGSGVTSISFDQYQQVQLILTDMTDEDYRINAELVIEATFLLRDGAGNWHELAPGTGSRLSPVLDLLGQSITSIDVENDDTLTVDFDGGSGLRVGPDTDWGEDWYVWGLGVSPDIVGRRESNPRS